jgi:hypothetical protein
MRKCIVPSRSGRLCPVGEKHFDDAWRKSRIVEDLWKVVNEMRTPKPCDIFDFLEPSRCEMHVFGSNAEPAHSFEETILTHPRPRRVTKIDPRRIAMAERSLVANDHDFMAIVTRVTKKAGDAVEQDRVLNALAVNMTLEMLPPFFTPRRGANRRPNGFLITPKSGIDQPEGARASNEHAVVVDECVVEVDADYLLRAHADGF